MVHPSRLNISDFTYHLPEEKIAFHPLEYRDASKLLFYENGRISDHTFTDLPELLLPGSLLVSNNSKVIKARLFFYKPTGGHVEIFLLEPTDVRNGYPAALATTGNTVWKCFVGNAAKWKEGAVSLKLKAGEKELVVEASKEGKENDAFLIGFSWNDESLSFAEIIELAGKMPLPPYIKRAADEEDSVRYQTVFSKIEGSVAAPTAGLHFTPEVLNKLLQKKIQKTEVTLHVGAGTFKPVKAESMAGHDMHEEFFEVSKATVEQLIDAKNIVAVGTTTLRTIESIYWLGEKLLRGDNIDEGLDQWDAYDENSDHPSLSESLHAVLEYLSNKQTDKLFTSTKILIAPGYQFKVADQLITNFHQPNSTLLLLVAAAIGDDWRRVYKHALENNYRFLSYGDSSLLSIEGKG